jgi:hypothetical protein
VLRLKSFVMSPPTVSMPNAQGGDIEREQVPAVEEDPDQLLHIWDVS